MKFYKYILCFILFFVLSCDRGYNSREEYSPLPERERRIDKRCSFGTDNERNRELDRLRTRSGFIEAELDSRFRGGYYYEALDGEDCDESSACKEICDLEISRKYRSKCYSAPRAVVEKLQDGIFELLTISGEEDCDNPVEISPGLLAGMLDIRTDLITDLVEDRMSEGDLKSFLAWVAINRGIAEVFLEEDRGAEVLRSAFHSLGKLQPDADEYIETGLNMGLVHNEDSFFYLSAVENNPAGFQIAYKVLKSVCRSRDCKMDVLCAREDINNRQSRIFRDTSSRNFSSRDPRSRNLSTIGRCRTSADQRRRSTGTSLCYTHGATTWSFLDELIEDEREIRDSDFTGENNEITVESCNNHCGYRRSSSRSNEDRETDICRRVK